MLKSLVLCSAAVATTVAHDYARLDEALPTNIDAESIAPVFDFDSDSCLPAAGISRDGDMNGGLQPTGSLTGACRSSNYLDLSNTYHRHVCRTTSGVKYCGHFYSLYFEKDQALEGSSIAGHRHDWEVAAVWTTNGVVTHGTYSAHGDGTTEAVANLGTDSNGHIKFVYHKDGIGTHSLRFSSSDEVAENPVGSFVTPVIVSWYEMRSPSFSSLVFRTLMNAFDYGSANLPVNDGHFLGDVIDFKPAGYPDFSWNDVLASNPYPTNPNFLFYAGVASGLCLDVFEINMADGTNVIQWDCIDGRWQKWHYDATTHMIHSLEDARFCLDNGGSFVNGANIKIWTCQEGNINQQFVLQDDDTIAMYTNTNFVLDVSSTAAGANVQLWWNWGGDSQKWVPL